MATNKALLDALKDVTQTSQDLQSTVANLKGYGQTNRRYIRLLVASVVFDILLSVGLGLVGFSAARTARKAETASSATVVACRAVKAATDTNTAQWRKILTFPPPPDETPAARAVRIKQTNEFKVFLAKSEAAVKDCK